MTKMLAITAIAGDLAMGEIINYVKPELVVVAVILYIIGVFLKRAEAFADKMIPFTLLGIGIIITALYVFATTPMSGVQEVCMSLFTIIVQGILLAGAAVLCSQMRIQAKKDS